MEMFMFLPPIFFMAIITLLCFFFGAFTINQRKRLPPGSYGWPIVGETIQYMSAFANGNVHEFFKKRQGNSGAGIIKSSLFGQKCIMLSGPKAVKFICANDKKLVTGWRLPSTQKLFLSYSINPIEDEHKKQRGYLGLLFKSESIKKLVNSVEFVAKSHLKDHWQIGKEVKVFDTVKLYAFSVACKVFLSIEDSNRISKLLTTFNDLTQGVACMVIYFPGTKYYRAKNAAILLRKEIRDIIQERRHMLAINVTQAPKDLLTQMLITPSSVDGNFITELQMIDYILAFWAGSFETTSATLAFTMKRLIQHPELAVEVFKEQEEIIEMMKPRDELIFEDVQKMKKTWNFLSESMRTLPTAVGFVREATTDFNFEGFHVPKGWKIFVNMDCTQKNPEYFHDPGRFDPSRFEKDGPQPYTYFPFGVGSHSCPGKEYARTTMLIFLHHVLTTYKWQPCIPEEGFKYKLVPTPNNGFPVRLFARST